MSGRRVWVNGGENNVGAAEAGNVADPVVPPPAEAPGPRSSRRDVGRALAGVVGGRNCRWSAASVVLGAVVNSALRAPRRVPRPLEPEAPPSRLRAGSAIAAEDGQRVLGEGMPTW